MISQRLRNIICGFFKVSCTTRFFSGSPIINMSTSLSSNELLVEVFEESDSEVIVFGLNRPSARNALGNTLTASLMNAVEKIHLCQNARVVIPRSLVPGVFCAGCDLKERMKLSNREVIVMVNRLSALATAIENIPVPTVVAIDGAALYKVDISSIQFYSHVKIPADSILIVLLDL